MNPPPLPPTSEAKASQLMIALGILFMMTWMGIATLLGGAKLMASLMANASGAASNSAHMAFIGGMIVGQLLSGFAGVPAGLAFFRKSRRKFLIILFIIMLLSGIGLQALSLFLFFE